MASEVEICNRALQKLGAARITSLTDGSKNARSCLTAYKALRDAELRKNRWNFSIQRFQLPQSATPPLFVRSASYPLPSGWLKVLAPDPEFNVNDRDWVVEGNSILSNDSSPLNVRLVMRIDDVNLMDPLFQEALAAKMAFEMCEEITQSNEKKSQLRDDYKDAIFEAKKQNAIDCVPQEPPLDTYVTARF